MTDADKTIIRRFAAGEATLRDQAIIIHRRWIPMIGVRGTPEQDFMAEVDTAQADHGLRATYRQRLVAIT